MGGEVAGRLLAVAATGKQLELTAEIRRPDRALTVASAPANAAGGCTPTNQGEPSVDTQGRIKLADSYLNCRVVKRDVAWLVIEEGNQREDA